MPLQSTLQHFPLLRLPNELIGLIMNNCDLPTLLALRRSCVVLSGHVTRILIAERDQLLLSYVTDTRALLQHLEQTRAVIGGFSALSFILRDPSIRPPSLEIFVPASSGARLVRLLCEDKKLQLHVQRLPQEPPVRSPLTQACIIAVTTMTASSDRTLTIFTSASESALEPIAASPVTALINWVSPSIFACGYPALTLKRASIVVEPTSFDFDFSLVLLFSQLAQHNFEISFEPSLLHGWANRVPPSSIPSRQPCLRQWFICPDQGRFFGDAGSLVTLFDLFNTDLDQLRILHQPPYGITVAWRLTLCSRRACTSQCEERDPILPTGFHVVSIILVEQGVHLRAMIY